MAQINVRWADNTKQLAANLKYGVDQIEATRASAEKMVRSLGGDNIVKAAHNMAAAVNEIGGAANLTAANQARVNAVMTKAVDVLNAAGKGSSDVAKHFQSLADQTKGAGKEFEIFGQSLTKFSAWLGAGFGGAIALAARQALNYADTLTKLSDRTGIGVVALQKLDAIATASGNSLEDIAGAVNKFQKQIASDAPAASAALAKIGLSIGQLEALSPEDQFIAIAKGIQSIQDPAQQTLIAIELFGKSGAEILPSLKANVDELADGATTMSAESVKALDDFGDAMSKVKANIVASAGEIIGAFLRIPGAIREATAGLPQPGETPEQRQARERLGTALGQGPARFSEAQQGPTAAELQKSLDDALKRLLQNVPRVLPDIRAGNKELEEFGLHLDEVQRAADKANLAIRHAANQEALAKAKQEAEQFAKAMVELSFATSGYGAALDSVNGDVVEAVKFYLKAGVAQNDLKTAYALTDVQIKAIVTSMEVEKRLIELVTTAVVDETAAWEKLGKQDVETIRNLKAKYDLIAKLHQIAFEKTPGLVDVGQLPGDATNEIGKLNEKFDKLTEKEKQAREAMSDLAQAFAQLAQVSGGQFSGIVQDIGRIVTAFNLAQQAIDKFKKASADKNIGGQLAAVASAIAAVAAATGSGSTASRIVGGAITGAEAGSVVPGVGTAIGAGAGALIGWARGAAAAKATAAEIRKMRNEFVDAAGGIDLLSRKVAEAGTNLVDLFQAKNAEDLARAVERITRALQFQSEATKTLQETIEKYKFKIKELGPAWEAQHLDEKAQELYKDFRVLLAGGIDQDVILKRMKKSFNDFVREAIKSGTAIPEALKPMIQRMIELGLLTDKNGHKFTSLEDTGLTFTKSMSTAFESLIQVVNRLAEAIARAFHITLPPLPGQGPGTTEPGNPGGGGKPGGGEPGGGGEPPSAFLPASLVPSRLTDGSASYTSGSQSMLAQSAVSGAAFTIQQHNTVNMDNRGALLDSAGLQRLARKLQNEGRFWETVRHNKDDAYPKARAAMNLPV